MVMDDSAQALVFSNDPEADRAFAHDLLGLSCADAGGGWLIFQLPPGQPGIDPFGNDDAHQLYLECRNLDQALAALAAHGVAAGQVAEADWGRAVSIALPGGGMIRLHESSARRT